MFLGNPSAFRGCPKALWEKVDWIRGSGDWLIFDVSRDSGEFTWLTWRPTLCAKLGCMTEKELMWYVSVILQDVLGFCFVEHEGDMQSGA